jgi:isoquinoline 1-oxidoreductase subunit beta
MHAHATMTRRGFLRTGAALGGGLLIGFALPGPGSRHGGGALHAEPAPNPLTTWVHIRPDNTVTLMVGSSEMGQGIDTALPMLLAEELEADWRTVHMALADADPVFNNPSFKNQVTGGSRSIRGYSELLRRAGATGRTMLLAAAAKRWGVAPGACRAENSVVSGPAGQRATYGELAEAAARLDAPADVALKKPSQWKLAGTSVKRLDTFAKVTGRAPYGIDVRLPGLRVGTIAAAPAFGGKLRGLDDRAAKAIRGVQAVLPLTGVPFLDDAVVVVADNYWTAKRGLEALKIDWDPGPHGDLDDAQVAATFRKGLDEPGVTAVDEGGAEQALAGAAKRMEALYEFPYLAHAPMEPMNATAHVTADGVEIWAPTQAPGIARAVVARFLGLAPERVKVHITFLGGGFGRRGEVDFVLRAVQAAKAVGGPVKVLWSREEDMRKGVFRPATLVQVRGGLDGAGKPVALHIKTVNSSIRARIAPQTVKDGLDRGALEGFAETPYGFPARKVDYVMKNLAVPVGFWRSVANTYSGFAMETFVDELARAAGEDPVRFRLALLTHQPRHTALLEQLARMSGWGTAPPAGRARGLALHQSFGSIVGEVAEVSLGAGGQYSVHQVWCVVDCGLVVNPDTVVAQMHSGIVYGLTAAQYGEINIQAGGVKQGNFPDYPMLKLKQTPAIDVHLMRNEEPHGGVGEPGTPPIAPAVANALFALSGKRVRSLPLHKHGFTLA